MRHAYQTFHQHRQHRRHRQRLHCTSATSNGDFKRGERYTQDQFKQYCTTCSWRIITILAQINAKRDDKFVVDGSNKSYTTRNEDTPEPLSEISSKQTPDTKPVSLSNATSNTGKSSSAGKHHMSFNPFSHHKSRKIRHQLPHQFHKMCHRYHQVVHLMHLLRILSRTHHQLHHHHQVYLVLFHRPHLLRQQYQIPYLQHYQLQNLLKITHLQCQRTYQATTHLRHRLCHQVLHPTTQNQKLHLHPHHQHKLQDQNTNPQARHQEFLLLISTI